LLAVGQHLGGITDGKERESAPRRRHILLLELTQEVKDILEIDPQSGIEFVEQIGADLKVDADGEQLFRVIHNLCRN
ncbi:sensor histidine kinase, partial [Rhizobium ruizarguesonis]